ncbi:MAG: DUF883 family protein [Chthoniobacterales bacterium]
MSKRKKTVSKYVETLTDDARELLAATSDSAGAHVKEARQRLTDALENGREIYDQVRDKASQGVKYADDSLHENPYAPIAVAFVLGAIVALLFTRRSND